MVEGGHQLDGPAVQHPVAEHVAGHVADADHPDPLASGVDAQLAEVLADRHPGAPGGDAHGLVVVAVATTGREGVTQPEPVLGADLVGQVGEGGGAPVGGDDQIGVLAVGWPHAGRGDDPAADHVVGDVEQPADEQPVALATSAVDLGGRPRPVSAARRRHTKPPLAPVGTMLAFLSTWARTRPSTSVRRSSWRSLQRMPPRAIRPARRCMPSTRGE